MISISEEEIETFSLDKLKPHIRKFWLPIFSRGGEGYKLLAWLAHQYDDSLFIDIGTWRGGSAICLASNPSNRVITVDYRDRRALVGDHFDLSAFRNLEFRMGYAMNIDPQTIAEAKVITIDIGHRGGTEKRLIKKFDEAGFKGIVVMDDINTDKFPGLRRIWNEIDKPKQIIPYGNKYGTGIVSFGPEVLVLC